MSDISLLASQQKIEISVNEYLNLKQTERDFEALVGAMLDGASLDYFDRLSFDNDSVRPMFQLVCNGAYKEKLQELLDKKSAEKNEENS